MDAVENVRKDSPHYAEVHVPTSPTTPAREPFRDEGRQPAEQMPAAAELKVGDNLTKAGVQPAPKETAKETPEFQPVTMPSDEVGVNIHTEPMGTRNTHHENVETDSGDQAARDARGRSPPAPSSRGSSFSCGLLACMGRQSAGRGSKARIGRKKSVPKSAKPESIMLKPEQTVGPSGVKEDNGAVGVPVITRVGPQYGQDAAELEETAREEVGEEMREQHRQEWDKFKNEVEAAVKPVATTAEVTVQETSQPVLEAERVGAAVPEPEGRASEQRGIAFAEVTERDEHQMEQLIAGTQEATVTRFDEETALKEVTAGGSPHAEQLAERGEEEALVEEHNRAAAFEDAPQAGEFESHDEKYVLSPQQQDVTAPDATAFDFPKRHTFPGVAGVSAPSGAMWASLASAQKAEDHVRESAFAEQPALQATEQLAFQATEQPKGSDMSEQSSSVSLGEVVIPVDEAKAKEKLSRKKHAKIDESHVQHVAVQVEMIEAGGFKTAESSVESEESLESREESQTSTESERDVGLPDSTKRSSEVVEYSQIVSVAEVTAKLEEQLMSERVAVIPPPPVARVSEKQELLQDERLGEKYDALLGTDSRADDAGALSPERQDFDGFSEAVSREHKIYEEPIREPAERHATPVDHHSPEHEVANDRAKPVTVPPTVLNIPFDGQPAENTAASAELDAQPSALPVAPRESKPAQAVVVEVSAHDQRIADTSLPRTASNEVKMAVTKSEMSLITPETPDEELKRTQFPIAGAKPSVRRSLQPEFELLARAQSSEQGYSIEPANIELQDSTGGSLASAHKSVGTSPVESPSRSVPDSFGVWSKFGRAACENCGFPSVRERINCWERRHFESVRAQFAS